MKPKSQFTHDTYLSPFAWRYGSEEMRAIWSELYKRRLWRRVWVALAAAQHQAGLVTAGQLADLRAHQDDVNLTRAAEIEVEIRHDLMAEIRAFAEQCSVGGPIIHLGATSADIQDNADALRIHESLGLLLERLHALLCDLADLIEARADQVCMGFTHIQPAEPTTVGYRLATYGQDLLEDYIELRRVRERLRGKGFKGAVGTAASYAQLLTGSGMTPAELEARVMAELGLEAFPVATQVYPRKQDYRVLTALAGVAASLYRFGFDLRLLQSPPIGEWSEPFGAKQVGSSAMPFKRNPVNAENVDSLARYVAALARTAWDNAAHSLLERTLDDSANRRLFLPDAFLASDELLRRAHHILRGLRIHDGAIKRNLDTYGTFAATERLLMELARAGADRQAMHELIRGHAMAAWGVVQRGEPNPLADLLAADRELLRYLPAGRVREALETSGHVGDAPERARRMAAAIRGTLGEKSARGSDEAQLIGQ
ncbi:MAG: adenylosuccinate lyase [Chloroflexota bacterium]|nr:adenylosuccinate lyase [Chloroflexota bacterium]